MTIFLPAGIHAKLVKQARLLGRSTRAQAAHLIAAMIHWNGVILGEDGTMVSMERKPRKVS